MIEIMPINRPDIIKAKLFKQRPAHRHPAREGNGLARRDVKRLRHFAREPLGQITQLKEGP